MQSDFTIEYSNIDKVYNALVKETRRFFEKSKLKRAVLGLSGGLDSTICAVILADSIGAENVFGVSLPSKLTPQTSNTDAEILAKNLGINYAVVPIINCVDSFNNEITPFFKFAESQWGGETKCKISFTQDNLQARTRAIILYALSNEYANTIPIATSDKSELYMGYSTLNGDSSGGFAPLADVEKTKLFALGYWLNDNRKDKNVIPLSILKKRPSAELAIDPKTGKLLCAEDALMPYEFIDEIIYLIEDKKLSKAEILGTQLAYSRKYFLSEQQKNEWLDKFFTRYIGQNFKLTFLPPAACLSDVSYLNNCNKAFY